MSKNLIRYLAVGRPDLHPQGEPKHEILSSLLTNDSDPQAKKYKDNAIKIIGKSHKVEPGKRIRLVADESEIHVQCEIGGNQQVLLLIAITDPEFGVHHNIASFFQDWGNQLKQALPIHEWIGKKATIGRRIDPVLLSIHKKYSSSALIDANRQVDQVKGVMTENINMSIQNLERVDELDQKAADIEQGSQEFESKAKKVKCRMIKQRIAIIALIVGIICVIALIIGLAVGLTVHSASKK